MTRVLIFVALLVTAGVILYLAVGAEDAVAWHSPQAALGLAFISMGFFGWAKRWAAARGGADC